MKKLTKILAMLLVCITVFSTASMAVDSNIIAEIQAETTPIDIELPDAPRKITQGYTWDDYINIKWDEVEGAEGYNVYLKKNNEWIYQTSVSTATARIENLLRHNRYRVGVKSYITVDGVKYESAEYTEKRVYGFSGMPIMEELKAMATPEGIKLTWELCKGISYYRIYIWKNSKWNKITDIKDSDVCEYIYKDVKVGQKYRFAVKPWVKGYKGTYGGGLDSYSITYPADLTKSEITYKKSVNAWTAELEWSEIENADGYRLYIFKDNKWSALKTVKGLAYTAEGLEPSTKYKFKVRAYFKVDGKTKWGTYSDEVSVTTYQAHVEAYRLEELKKYFTDGDWSVKLGGKKDSKGNVYTLTLAINGKKIFVRYDYENNKKVSDVEYLIYSDKNKIYKIDDADKTYTLMSGADGKRLISDIKNLVSAIDMSDVDNVVGKTTIYKDKTAVAEYYRNKPIGIQKKTYYYINEKLSGLKINYTDGTAESFTSIEIKDTPSSSVFKIPSGYKKVAY